MHFLDIGHFIDVTIEAGLGAQPYPRTLADERSGHTNLTPYRVKNVGLFKDIMPGPYILSAMFADIDADGKRFIFYGVKMYIWRYHVQIPSIIRRTPHLTN